MDEIKRLNYFDGQFLIADDFQAEQNYYRQMRHQHNRTLHSPGIMDGLVVTKVSNNNRQITVSPGNAMDAQGREIVLVANRILDLTLFGINAIIFVTIKFNDSERDEVDRRSGDFARIPERPEVVLTAQEPPKDRSVIVLARVQLDNQGNIGSIDESVRSRQAGAAIAPDTVTLDHLTKPVRESITGHNHDGNNSQKISPANLAGVNSTVTATNLNIICASAGNTTYHVPLVPQKLKGTDAEFEVDGITLFCPKGKTAGGLIPLYFPHNAQLTRITIDLSPTPFFDSGQAENPSKFKVNLELNQVVNQVPSGNLPKSAISFFNTEIVNTGSPEPKLVTRTFSRTINNALSWYWLKIKVDATSSTVNTGGVFIRAIFIDYTF